MHYELREFIESHCKLTYIPGCAFAEFKSDKRDINEKKEVLLMDKVSRMYSYYIIILQSNILAMNTYSMQKTEEIFTGPGVLKMIGAPGQNIKRPTLDRWRVFVQSTQGTGLVHEGSILLYEVMLSNINNQSSIIIMIICMPAESWIW